MCEEPEMKGLVWFVVGIAGGFVVAHFANRTARGQLLFAELDARIGEFSDLVSHAYREQEAKFADTPEETKP